jgi:hypothetical protein
MLPRNKWQPKSWATILQPFKIVFWLMRQPLLIINMKGKNCIWTLIIYYPVPVYLNTNCREID